jgi:hypothetical protein
LLAAPGLVRPAASMRDRPPFLRVGRFIRFDPAEIADWLNSNRVPRFRAESHKAVVAQHYRVNGVRRPSLLGQGSCPIVVARCAALPREQKKEARGLHPAGTPDEPSSTTVAGT